MGEPQVDQNQLDQIGDFVKSHLGQWIQEQNISLFPVRDKSLDKELLERMIRVEEGLKNQMELTRQGFENMEKRFIERFEAVDKRFEAVDKRFEAVDKHFEAVDKHFEAVDKRFEDMQHYMDKRFNVQTWIISAGFAMMTILMSLYRFFG